jgi:hypothetical protein
MHPAKQKTVLKTFLFVHFLVDLTRFPDAPQDAIVEFLLKRPDNLIPSFALDLPNKSPGKWLLPLLEDQRSLGSIPLQFSRQLRSVDTVARFDLYAENVVKSGETSETFSIAQLNDLFPVFELLVTHDRFWLGVLMLLGDTSRG